MVRNDDRRDSLTGLASRGRLERSLTRRCRGPEKVVGDTVILVDVAGLKEVNRTRGFLAGDDLIVQVARRLERLSRGLALIGRLGGDEFLALYRPRHAAMADRFVASLLRPGSSPAVRVATTTIAPHDTPRRVIARLDAALRAVRDEPPQSETRSAETRLDDPPSGPNNAGPA